MQSNRFIIEKLDSFIKELEIIGEEGFSSTTSALFYEMLERWKERVKQWLEKNISREKADKLDRKERGGIYLDDLKDSIIGTVDLYRNYLWVLQDEIEKNPATILQEAPQQKTTQGEPATTANGKGVFIVHGQDQVIKEQVARFLERLEFEPIILHEKPSKGRTIIEKFEDYSDVAYAIVLLTGDDIGSLLSEEDEFKPRARQNVVFELGFFTGKLGRNRVCALYEKNVELPSDFKGVVYIPLDKEGGWKLSLARELKAAGLKVNLDKVV